MASLLTRRRLAIVLLATLIAFIRPARGEDNSVVLLDTGSFDTALTLNPLLAVTFYAPWCGHCKSLDPEFETAARTLKGRVAFGKVDATVEVDLTERFNIDGYPTVLLFAQGRQEEFVGARNNRTLVEWILHRAGQALTYIGGEDGVNKLLLGRKSSSFFIASGSNAFREVFSDVAEENRVLGSFFFVNGTSQAEPLVRVYRGKGEEVERSFVVAAGSAPVVEFLRKESLPLFGEIDEGNFNSYMATLPAGVLWLCVPDRVAKEVVPWAADTFRAVADQQRSLRVVHINTDLYHEHAHNELGCKNAPLAVLQLGDLTAHDQEPMRYRLSLQSDEELGRLGDWVSSALAGNLEADDLEAAVEDEREIEEDELDSLAQEAPYGSDAADAEATADGEL